MKKMPMKNKEMKHEMKESKREEKMEMKGKPCKSCGKKSCKC